MGDIGPANFQNQFLFGMADLVLSSFKTELHSVDLTDETRPVCIVFLWLGTG